MKLSERLKRLEAKAPTEQKIQVIKFGTELKYLQYGGDKYYRFENEAEDRFTERVLDIVKKNPHPNGFYLVGNIC
jgi:hypothetical protein